MEISIGVVLILGAAYYAFSRKYLPLIYLAFFAIGGLVGLVWEVGFTFGGMGYPIHPGGAPNPQGADIADLPIYVIAIILVMVCVWDGFLLVCGLVIARLVLGSSVERRFSLPAFLIMQAFGQAQSLVIEIYAIETGMWAYAPSPLNPQLFSWGEAQITALPQLVWLLGFCAFYGAVLAVFSRQAAKPQPAP